MAFDLDIEGMVFEAARDGAGAQGSASAPGRERAVAPTLTEDDLELDFSLRDVYKRQVYILSEKTAKWQEEPVEVTRYEKK